MIDGLVLYWTFAGLFGLATIGFLGWSFQHPSGRRRYGLAVAGACLVMAVANTMMANEILTTTADGAAYPHARFLGYFVSFTVVSWLLGAIAGASRNLTVLLILAVNALPGSVLASWNLPEPAATVASVLVFVSIVIAAALLVGPIDRAATRVSGERRLLYGKLRNLSVTVWIVLPIVGVMSEQNLAILTSFAGIFMGTYLDLILFVGVGALVLRSPTALDQLAGRDGNERSVSPDRTSGRVDSDFEIGSAGDD
ncbi:bacteriorhodopsin [Natronobacterium gregoryi]|uniref:Rhodopsin n=2 Tax=Natronobacterium gregoryi TaxID=44930 RepID=L0AG52_NATGS|nr:bacteriorhodopsin [Natronobacterium gregoryi]AFZ72112.1 bacteriorhodopsin [Natronobacterium gregoryi SP2]ELY62857.1 rhodopsin [Natronobacterium gregoryi SP2]PLK20086.1 rhodopsin [Natronobacterium gregoryi SP2]SFJ58423.1 Bacteriorhodopsin [Natronobacterium gregoryi]